MEDTNKINMHINLEEQLIRDFRNLTTPSKESVVRAVKRFRVEDDLDYLESDLDIRKRMPKLDELKVETKVQNFSIQKDEQNKFIKKAFKYTEEEYKKIALEAFQLGNNCEIAKKYDISEKTIRRYKEKFKGQFDKETKKTFAKKQHRAKFPELKKHLVQWIRSEREKKNIISFENIRDKARSLTTEDFKASNGWICNFLKRNKIVQRVSTHVVQKYKENFESEIKLFLQEVNKVQICSDLFNPKNTIYINFDEMPVYFDMSRGRTYSFKGEREVGLKKNVGVKKRISVLSTICSNGLKLPSILICK